MVVVNQAREMPEQLLIDRLLDSRVCEWKNIIPLAFVL